MILCSDSVAEDNKIQVDTNAHKYNIKYRDTNTKNTSKTNKKYQIPEWEKYKIPRERNRKFQG